MMDRKHQRAVEERLRHALQIDKARVQTGRISRFGLLEMSRQRLRPSLGESSQEPCPRCEGHGRIRSVESLALSILRLVEEESMKEYTGQVIVQAPTTVANFLLNEKRKGLAEIETRHRVPVIVIANEYMERPKFEIHRVRKSEVKEELSYDRVVQPEAELVASAKTQAIGAGAAQTPAVRTVMPARPVPVRPEEEEKPETKQGFFGALFARLFGSTEPAEKKEPTRKPRAESAPKPAQKSEPAGGGRPQRQKQQSGTSKGGQRSGKKKPRKSDGGPAQEQREAGGAKKKSRRKPRKKTSRKKNAPSQQAAADKSSTADKTSGGGKKEERQAGAPEAASKDAQENASRRGRRRRSPYQTSGAKQRDEQTRAASKETPEGTGDQKPEPAPKRAESGPDAPAKSDAASKGPEQLALPAGGRSSAGQLVEVSRDSKGIYTLKPATTEASERPAGDKPERKPAAETSESPAAAKAEGGKPPVTETADRA
jgi:ribonuclease E